MSGAVVALPAPEIALARKFLTQLYKDALETDPEAHIALVSFPDKRTSRFRDLGAAATHTIERSAQFDVYVACALQGPPRGDRPHRDKAAHVRGIVAAWADLDVGVGKSGKRYFPTAEAALEFIHGLPLKPTIVIHSGTGYHVWWRFREPWMFDNDAEREQAKQLLARWQARLTADCQRCGAALDPTTADLARILRIPGTLHHESGNPVTVVWDDGPAINPSKIDEHCADSIVVPIRRNDTDEGGANAFVLNRLAELPPRLDVLRQNDERFRKTWEHQRPDLNDQSPSGYDMAIASAAVAAGADDQEIADALNAFRRRHKLEPEKVLQRPEYVASTIAKARASIRPPPHLWSQNRSTLRALPFVARTSGMPTASSLATAGTCDTAPPIRNGSSGTGRDGNPMQRRR